MKISQPFAMVFRKLQVLSGVLCLLSFRRYGLSRTSKSDKEAEKEARKKALEAGMTAATKARSDSVDSEESREKEEKRIQALMKGMSISEEVRPPSRGKAGEREELESIQNRHQTVW